VSPTTALGIALIVMGAVGIAIAAAMFLWAAREDGRDQRRRDARLSSGRRNE
jgi:hypothetical protein